MIYTATSCKNKALKQVRCQSMTQAEKKPINQFRYLDEPMNMIPITHSPLPNNHSPYYQQFYQIASSASDLDSDSEIQPTSSNYPPLSPTSSNLKNTIDLAFILIQQNQSIKHKIQQVQALFKQELLKTDIFEQRIQKNLITIQQIKKQNEQRRRIEVEESFRPYKSIELGSTIHTDVWKKQFEDDNVEDLWERNQTEFPMKKENKRISLNHPQVGRNIQKRQRKSQIFPLKTTMKQKIQESLKDWKYIPKYQILNQVIRNQHSKKNYLQITSCKENIKKQKIDHRLVLNIDKIRERKKLNLNPEFQF